MSPIASWSEVKDRDRTREIWVAAQQCVAGTEGWERNKEMEAAQSITQLGTAVQLDTNSYTILQTRDHSLRLARLATQPKPHARIVDLEWVALVRWCAQRDLLHDDRRRVGGVPIVRRMRRGLVCCREGLYHRQRVLTLR